MRITTAGAAALLLWLAFLLCAFNTNTNLLFVLSGLLLSAVLVNLFVVALALRGLGVERTAPPVAVAGEPFTVRFRLWRRDGKSIVLPFGMEEATLPAWKLPSGPVRLSVAGLGGEGVTASCEVVLARVGRTRLPKVRVSTSAPFGLFERSRVYALRDEVLVLPPVRKLDPSILRLHADLSAGLVSRMLRGEERRDRLRSLREHRPGDDPRSVHWRSTARRGQLVIKEFERTIPQEAAIVVDLAAPTLPLEDDEQPPPEQARCEEALVLAASLASALLARGEPVALAIADRNAPVYVPHSGGRAALDRLRLALAGAEPGEAPDLEAALRKGGDALKRGRVFLITTRGGEAPGGLGRAKVLDLSQGRRYTRGPALHAHAEEPNEDPSSAEPEGPAAEGLNPDSATQTPSLEAPDTALSAADAPSAERAPAVAAAGKGEPS